MPPTNDALSEAVSVPTEAIFTEHAGQARMKEVNNFVSIA